MTRDPSGATNAFKALSHPARLRIFYSVAASGEATATMLGKELEMSPAAVSYHLTKMGEYGILKESDTQGRDGRERWWKLATDGVTFGDDTEQADALQFAVLRHHHDRLSHFLAEQSAREPGVNAVGAFSSDMVLRLDRATAERFQEEVVELLKRYAGAEDAVGDPVFVMLQGIPFVP